MAFVFMSCHASFYLADNFARYEPDMLVELMASFVYVERFPINFISKVFTPHFFARLHCELYTIVAC